MRWAKAWTTIDRQSIIWKSDVIDKIKRDFFQTLAVSILLCGCTKWTLRKRMEKQLNGNCTKMLRAILNKFWMQYSTKQQLYSHLPPISKTIQIRGVRHVRHCWRSVTELIHDVLLWTFSHGRASVGQSTRTYLQKLCTDTGWRLEGLPEAMVDRDEWRERERESRKSVLTAWHDDDIYVLSFKLFHDIYIHNSEIIKIFQLTRKIHL